MLEIVRRRVYLTAIVPQQPLHIIVAIHLLNQVIGIIVFLLGMYIRDKTYISRDETENC